MINRNNIFLNIMTNAKIVNDLLQKPIIKITYNKENKSLDNGTAEITYNRPDLLDAYYTMNYRFGNKYAECITTLNSLLSDSSQKQEEQHLLTILPVGYNLKWFYISIIPESNCNAGITFNRSPLPLAIFLKENYYIDEIKNKMSNFKISTFSDEKLILSSRQHEILFLLSNKVTQTKIASCLNISRGTINTVLNRVAGKFEMTSFNINDIIERSISLNINNLIPPSLVFPSIIVY